MSSQLLHLIQSFQRRVQLLAPDAYDEELFARLQRSLPAARDYAPILDFADIECNGIRMIVRHAESYIRVANTKKRASEVREFMHVIKMIDVWCNLLTTFQGLQSSGE